MNLKKNLIDRQLSVGSWMSLGVPAVAEIMADAGFDWLVIDLEHTAITIGEAENLIRTVDLKGLPALVRVSANDPVQIKRVLDAGAHGVLVPSVNSVAEAQAAVSATRYPPSGTRGVGLSRAQGYGPRFKEYVEQMSDGVIVIAQIEHVTAIEQLDEILSVPGIDATIIGPYDLSGSVGRPGELEHPDVIDLLRRYEEASRVAEKAMGYHVIDPTAEALLEKVEAGYTFLALSTDFLFLGEACRSQMIRVRRAIKDEGSGNS